MTNQNDNYNPYENQNQTAADNPYLFGEQQPNQPPQYNKPNQPGKGQAIASMVIGIIAVVFCFWPIVSLILGIIGLVLASQAKNAGYTGGMRKAGFVLSLIGLIIGVIVLLCCIVLIGSVAMLAL